MELELKAKKFGGSIGVIIPKDIVQQERIRESDNLKVVFKKVADLRFMTGMCKDVKISTKQILDEIDEGETEDE